MAYIKTISPWRAQGEVREIYKEIRRDMVGSRPVPMALAVVNILRIFSLRPTFLRAFERCFLLTMWSGVLRRQAKEAIGVSVAQTNSCHY
jgi:hypothetical protein